MPYSNYLVNHASSSTGVDLLSNAKEFIKDKLYFTSLASVPTQFQHIHFFTIDSSLVYVNFYSDFGPLNIAHLYRFCALMQEKLRNPATANKKICLYTSLENDKRANAAFLMCAYMTPDEAYQPLMGLSPPFIPYRDAGYGAATYHITVLDCVRGLYKALMTGLFDPYAFNLEQYEFYEKVENGDFNWLTKKFLALATPKEEHPPPHFVSRPNAGPIVNLFGGEKQVNRNYSCYNADNLVRFMVENGIKTIIRLNNKTYERKRFGDAGIEHIDLYFPDGTTPPDGILKKFLEICESREGPIAVHCKAGLGRTGSLIACYLMKHYRLTACEVIAFLRIIRPGSVVGPQQNYLQAMQSRLWKLHPITQLPPEISCWYPTPFMSVSLIKPQEKRLNAADVMMVDSEDSLMEFEQEPILLHSGIHKAPKAFESSTAADMIQFENLAIPIQPRKNIVVKPDDKRPNYAPRPLVQPTYANQVRGYNLRSVPGKKDEIDLVMVGGKLESKLPTPKPLQQ